MAATAPARCAGSSRHRHLPHRGECLRLMRRGHRSRESGGLMARVFITGAADGLGMMAARLLADDGHSVTLHARSAARPAEARAAVPMADSVVIGDLAGIDGMRSVAEQANGLGPFDAVIHNAGVGYREPRRVGTADGLQHVFAINVLAPYL